jgi:DNA-binding HxlR family transcriptional regulator
MTGYGQFCPVAKAAEVFSERWTPLILREMLHGSHRFSELQRGLPRVSQSLLAGRLKRLERDGVIERRRGIADRGWEYHLTPAGEEAGQIVEALGAWGYRWASAQLRADDLDPDVLLWFIHRHVHVERLPARRVVVQFDLRDHRKKHWWLILKRPEVELCIRDEGFEVDLMVTTDTLALTQVYLGRVPLAQAIAGGTVVVDGPRDLARGLVRWIGVSQYVRYGLPPANSVAG